MNGAAPFSINDTFTDSAGHVLRIDRLRFLVSAPWVQDDAHKLIAEFPAVAGLVDAAQPGDRTIAVGPLPAGHLHGVAFALGLAPTASGSALLNDDPSLSWQGPEGGAIFLELCGRVDGSGDDAVGTADPTFRIVCAGATMLTYCQIDAHYDLVPGESHVTNAAVEVQRLFDGVDVLADTSVLGATPVGQRVLQNLSLAIRSMD
ncbi:MAG: hypothetical protein QM724_07660 [Flavobacteriales bacterium]